MRQERGDAVGHHLARGGNVARALRQAADHQHQAFGADRGGLIDRALVVVDRGLTAGGIGARGNMPPRQ